jgi:hypothetical protein
VPHMHVILEVNIPSAEQDPLKRFDPLNDFLIGEYSYLTWRRTDQRLPNHATLYSFTEVHGSERVHRTFSGAPLFPPYAWWARKLLFGPKDQLYEHSDLYGLFGPVNFMDEILDKLEVAQKFVDSFFPGEYFLPQRLWLSGPRWRELRAEFAQRLIAQQAAAA